MKYFAGLDVSLEETAICVVDETGRIVKELRAASDPQALIDALGEIGLPLERIGLEACSLAAWLYDRPCGRWARAISLRVQSLGAKAFNGRDTD